MVLIMKKPKWTNSTTRTKPSFCESRLGRMLRLLNIKFEQRAYVSGKEVDFLVKRAGKKGLIIEADGDRYHLNEEKRKIRDKHLKNAGFDIVHIWCSEIEDAPEIPYADLAKLFKISKPPSIIKERKNAGKTQVSRSPKSPHKKKYKI